ncbi:uncharacterized protein N7483_006324 [Penicillium malachiteum]|uniref:uncharacterized protein n=1 Tax=Penicillium malachiteum TaxID=1324776 RepID=UPI002547E384|nr:uncharacterized protein N7483_006324 [Penicillium malachiteum]KAJ5724967.1 hypothetical protein N7483_006324 [Penicillium malachiteum]
MHCLSEVQEKDGQFWKEKLEDKLTELLLAEYEIAETSYLAEATEFPPRSLIQALNQGSEEQEISILSSINRRLFFEGGVMDLLIHWLNCPISKRKAVAVLDALRIDQGLQQLQERNPDALTVILGWLGDEEYRIREAAVNLLDRWSLSPEALTMIVRCLGDENWYVCNAAVQVLKRQDLSPDSTFPAILRYLGDEKWCISEAAVQGLDREDISPNALLAIVERLEDEHSGVRQMAAWVLKRQELNPDLLTAVAKQLRDKEWYTREAAVCALDREELAPDALKAIIGQLEDDIQMFGRQPFRRSRDKS